MDRQTNTQTNITLKDSIKVNQLQLSNRLVMPPMATRTSPDGSVTEGVIDYYVARTTGESVGLLITEHSYITPEGRADDKQMGLDSDDKIPGLEKLTDAIHQAGQSKIFAQINHAGNMTTSAITGHPTVSSSAIISPAGRSKEMPRELTIFEIKQIITRFAQAAARAKAAGFDGVEIHAAHDYLLNQFYSPLNNKRTDLYGGSLDNRIRLHLEVIKGVRDAVGPDYPVALRLGGADYMEGGATIDDTVYAAKQFEAAGIDLIDLSGGMCLYMRKDHLESGYFSDMSTAVKAALSIPVILTGGIKTGADTQQLLENNTADLIGAGRIMINQPTWANEVLKES